MARIIETDIDNKYVPTIVQVPEMFILQSALTLEKQNANNIFSQILKFSPILLNE